MGTEILPRQGSCILDKREKNKWWDRRPPQDLELDIPRTTPCGSSSTLNCEENDYLAPFHRPPYSIIKLLISKRKWLASFLINESIKNPGKLGFRGSRKSDTGHHHLYLGERCGFGAGRMGLPPPVCRLTRAGGKPALVEIL